MATAEEKTTLQNKDNKSEKHNEKGIYTISIVCNIKNCWYLICTIFK